MISQKPNNESHPFFSVVLPTYNRAHLIAQTLKSIFDQTFFDFEVIVVDDGSTDGSDSVVQQFPNAKLLRQKNAGPGQARNTGASAAKGKYLAFLDSDDLWLPWALKTYHQVLTENPAVVFLAGKQQTFENTTQLKSVDQLPLEYETFPDYIASCDQWRWFGVSSFVIERIAFLEAGGFAKENANGEDAELALQLGCAGEFADVSQPITFGYRVHQSNIATDITKNLVSSRKLIDFEREQRFPGGKDRAAERRQIISRHIRPCVISCLRSGRLAAGAELYRKTFLWNLMEKRFKFLLAAPVFAVLNNKEKTAKERSHA